MAKKIKLKDRVETMHNWIDDNGDVCSRTIAAPEGAEITAAKLAEEGIGDPERCLDKLVKLDLAEVIE